MMMKIGLKYIFFVKDRIKIKNIQKKVKLTICDAKTHPVNANIPATNK
jgi:hypothetical protein